MKTSLTQIRKILSQSAFNPRKPGPMKVIADVGDPNYYRQRALELITHDGKQNIKQAIGLLALYIATGVLDNEKDKD